MGYIYKCKKKTGQLMLSGHFFENVTKGTVPFVSFFLLEVTNGVVNRLALVLTVEQQREVVGTQP